MADIERLFPNPDGAMGAYIAESAALDEHVALTVRAVNACNLAKDAGDVEAIESASAAHEETRGQARAYMGAMLETIHERGEDPLEYLAAVAMTVRNGGNDAKDSIENIALMQARFAQGQTPVAVVGTYIDADHPSLVAVGLSPEHISVVRPSDERYITHPRESSRLQSGDLRLALALDGLNVIGRRDNLWGAPAWHEGGNTLVTVLQNHPIRIVNSREGVEDSRITVAGSQSPEPADARLLWPAQTLGMVSVVAYGEEAVAATLRHIAYLPPRRNSIDRKRYLRQGDLGAVAQNVGVRPEVVLGEAARAAVKGRFIDGIDEIVRAQVSSTNDRLQIHYELDLEPRYWPVAATRAVLKYLGEEELVKATATHALAGVYAEVTLRPSPKRIMDTAEAVATVLYGVFGEALDPEELATAADAKYIPGPGDYL